MHSLRMWTKHSIPSGKNKIIWKRFNSEPALIRFALLALVSGYTQCSVLALMSGYTQGTVLLLQVGLLLEKTFFALEKPSKWVKIAGCPLLEAICKPLGFGICCRALQTLAFLLHHILYVPCYVRRVVLFAAWGSGIWSEEYSHRKCNPAIRDNT